MLPPRNTSREFGLNFYNLPAPLLARKFPPAPTDLTHNQLLRSTDKNRKATQPRLQRKSVRIMLEKEHTRYHLREQSSFSDLNTSTRSSETPKCTKRLLGNMPRRTKTHKIPTGALPQNTFWITSWHAYCSAKNDMHDNGARQQDAGRMQGTMARTKLVRRRFPG